MKTTEAGRRKGAGGKPNLYQTRAIRVPIDLIPAITTRSVATSMSRPDARIFEPRRAGHTTMTTRNARLRR